MISAVTRWIASVACIFLALTAAALLTLGLLIPNGVRMSVGQLLSRDARAVIGEVELHVLGDPLTGARQLLSLDPGGTGPVGRDAADYLASNDPTQRQRLSILNRLAGRGIVPEGAAFVAVSQVLHTADLKLFPSAVRLADHLAAHQRAVLADRLDSSGLIAKDHGNWHQVLNWALSVDRTPSVRFRMATYLNQAALRQTNLTRQAALLDEAVQDYATNPIITANWADTEAQIAMRTGTTTTFPTYEADLEAGLQATSTPSNYATVLAQLQAYEPPSTTTTSLTTVAPTTSTAVTATPTTTA